jgi:porphobilinogen synthase
MTSRELSTNDAVSPVFATLLIIFLSIILISIFVIVLIGFEIPEQAPIVGISIGHQDDVITVTHLNGEMLTKGSYKILVDGVDKTDKFGADCNFCPGMTLRWEGESAEIMAVSVVYMGTNGGETILAMKNFK